MASVVLFFLNVKLNIEEGTHLRRDIGGYVLNSLQRELGYSRPAGNVFYFPMEDLSLSFTTFPSGCPYLYYPNTDHREKSSLTGLSVRDMDVVDSLEVEVLDRGRNRF